MTSNLNWLDYVFIAIFAFSMLAGFGRGLVKELVSLASIVAGFIVATMFATTLAQQFTSSAAVQSVVTDASTTIGMNAAQPVSYAAIGVSFGLLFAGTVLVGALIGFFLNMAFSVGILGLGNRILGALFGLARGGIINLVIIFMLQMTALGTQPWWQASVVVQQYQPAVVWVGNLVAPGIANLKQKANDALQNVNSKFQSITQ